MINVDFNDNYNRTYAKESIEGIKIYKTLLKHY